MIGAIEVIMEQHKIVVDEIREDHVLRFYDANTGSNLIWLKKSTSKRGFVAIREFQELDPHTNVIHRRFENLKFYDDQLTAIREICRRFGPDNPIGIHIAFDVMDGVV